MTVTGTPSNIVVTPADTAIRMTGTIQYRATVLDETGDTIRGVAVTWRSNDTSIATITGNGLATAKSKAGATFISAVYGNRVGSGVLTVLDSMIVARTNLAGRPHAAAIFANIAYVTQLDLARVARANLPYIVFWNYKEKYASNPVIDLLREKPYQHRVTAELVPLTRSYLVSQEGQNFAAFFY